MTLFSQFNQTSKYKQPPTGASCLESYSATDSGRRRDHNEDTYPAYPDQGLWAVADGMGGHAAGEVASAIVRDRLQQAADNNDNIPQAIQACHRALFDAIEQNIGAPGMGSTLVAVSSQQLHYEIFWVGDSRAYLWDNGDNRGDKGNNQGRLEQLSRDHSYVQMLVDSGRISTEEAKHHPEKNIITQCLGAQELEQVKVDHLKRRWQSQQWIILCSDGLSNELDDATMAQILSDSSSPQAAVEALMQTALNHGGHDNITVQVIAGPQVNSHFNRLRHWLNCF